MARGNSNVVPAVPAPRIKAKGTVIQGPMPGRTGTVHGGGHGKAGGGKKNPTRDPRMH